MVKPTWSGCQLVLGWRLFQTAIILCLAMRESVITSFDPKLNIHKTRDFGELKRE